MAGPLVTALLFNWIRADKQKTRDYWKRVFDFKRITLCWYLVILVLMPTITLIALLLSGDWQSYVFKSMIGSIPFTLLVTPMVPILEELGWRGYVLDLLQERFTALSSALILGTVWGLWHLPAFFFFEGGGVFTNMPLGSLTFYLYFVNLVLVSIIMHWIYNNTKRSILSAVLMHSMLLILVNFGAWHWYSESIIYYSATLLITCVGIVYYFGAKTLTLKGTL